MSRFVRVCGRYPIGSKSGLTKIGQIEESVFIPFIDEDPCQPRIQCLVDRLSLDSFKSTKADQSLMESGSEDDVRACLKTVPLATDLEAVLSRKPSGTEAKTKCESARVDSSVFEANQPTSNRATANLNLKPDVT